MKKRYYDVGTFIYMRQQKRTTGLIIGAAISAVAGLASSGINAASQSAANSTNVQLNKDTLEQQEKLFHEANQFNHDEAILNREFNSSEAQIARDFNSSEAEKSREFQAGMVEKYLQETSPSAQVSKTLAAGLNPAGLIGTTQQGFSIPSGSVASASPASGSSASSAGVPQLPVAKVNPVNYGDIAKSAIESASSFMDLKGKGEDIKTKVTKNQYLDALESAGVDVKRAEANLLYKQHEEISANIDKVHTEIDKLTADIGLVNKQGKWYDKQGDLIDEQRISYEIDNIFKGEHWQTIIRREAAAAGLDELHAKWYAAFVQSQIASNYGAAAYSNSLSALTDVEKEFKRKGMDYELDTLKEFRNYYENTNDILGIEKRVKRATEQKAKEETIKALEWQNSIWNRGAEFMGKLITPVVGAGMLYFGAKGMKSGPATLPVKGSGNIGFKTN